MLFYFQMPDVHITDSSGGGGDADYSMSSYSSTSTVCAVISRINVESGQILFMP